MNTDGISHPKEKPSNGFAIASVILAIVPIVAFLRIRFFYDAVSIWKIPGDVGRGLWPVFMFLFGTSFIISLMADILAVIFGMVAIRKHEVWFSWLGIIIVAAEALILATLL